MATKIEYATAFLQRNETLRYDFKMRLWNSDNVPGLVREYLRENVPLGSRNRGSAAHAAGVLAKARIMTQLREPRS